MSNTENRRKRRASGATGAYIALLLAATVLAVAGYRTLIPHTKDELPVTPEAAAPAETQTVSPPAAQTAETPASAPERSLEKPQQTQRRASAPVQGAAEVRLPAAQPVAPAASAPTLVVPPLTGETVAAFSMEELQYSETLGDWRTHNGVDVAAEAGTPVCAAAAGTVLDVRDDDLMGTTVVISHDGGLETVYANLQAIPTVEIGDYVTAGQIIGAVGRTALSESAQGAHLHFSVTRNGQYVDPAAYLKGG